MGHIDAHLTGVGYAASVVGAHLLDLLDVRRCGFRCVLYRAVHDGVDRRQEGVKILSPKFNSMPIAIMVQLDSPLRRKIDVALIKLRENGTYQQIYDKWFGGP